MDVTTAWFIDAWAVYDGVAFASRSTPEIRRTDRMTDAESTVFLSVPDLEPIPLGRITTGLRAARSSFQDGFFDLEGTEIAFDSLDGVREAVRRAYLTGGLGPGGAAVPPRPAPPPPIDVDSGSEPPAPRGGADGSEGPERPDEPAGGAATSDGSPPFTPSAGGLHFLDSLGELSADDGPPLKVAQVLLADRPEVVRNAVRAFAEAVLLDWEAALSADLPETQDALAELYAEFAAAGIWRRARDLTEFARRNHLTVGTRYRTYRRGATGRQYSAQQLIASAPWPAMPGQLVFSRWSDPLKLAFCDSQYLVDGGLRKVAPVVAAAILVGTGDGAPSGFWHSEEAVLDHRIRQALDWLERQIPRRELPDVADRLLNELARRWLTGPPDFPGPSNTHPPSTGPSADDSTTAEDDEHPARGIAEDEEQPGWDVAKDSGPADWTIVDDSEPGDWIIGDDRPPTQRINVRPEDPPAGVMHA